MKKIIIIISVIVIAIISCVYVKYLDYSKTVRETKSINNEFLAYRNSKIRISKVISLMGKAIELNKNNGIKQDENKLFSENDTNSIKIYLEVKSSDEKKIVTIQMEEMMEKTDLDRGLRLSRYRAGRGLLSPHSICARPLLLKCMTSPGEQRAKRTGQLLRVFRGLRRYC